MIIPAAAIICKYNIGMAKIARKSLSFIMEEKSQSLQIFVCTSCDVVHCPPLESLLFPSVGHNFTVSLLACSGATVLVAS